MTNRQQLRSELTRVTDNSPCSYETIIQELWRQIAWQYKAQRDEMRARKSEGS